MARWLRDYEEAWNAGDTAKLTRLRGLDVAEVWSLRQLLEERPNLRVQLNDVQIQQLGDGLARATYVRMDRWADAQSGRARWSTTAYEQTFRIHHGVVEELSLRRR